MFKALIALLITCTLFLLIANAYKKIMQKRKRVFSVQDDAKLPQIKSVSALDFKRKIHVIAYHGVDYILVTGGPNDVVLNPHASDAVMQTVEGAVS